MSEDEVNWADEVFPERVARVFIDGSRTSRLARALENSPRNVQKWMSAVDDAPPHAREFIANQLDILTNKLKPHPYMEIRSIMERSLEAGVHPEVMASILSKLYEELTGAAIR